MFWRKKKPIIEFFSSQPDFGWNPGPAKKFIPQWYKDQNTHIGEHRGKYKFLNEDKTAFLNNRTIKQCIPVRDALTSGYIIPHTTDLFFYKSLDKETGDVNVVGEMCKAEQPSYLDVMQGEANFPSIAHHTIEQADKHPAANKQPGKIFKFYNPWVVRTPPGYSCLFIPPLHHEQMSTPWEILPGVVDTDVYPVPVQFPFLLNLKIGQELLIEAGTPMVQVIPFKRDEWCHSIYHHGDENNVFKEHWISKSVVTTKFRNAYRDFFWQKKSYK